MTELQNFFTACFNQDWVVDYGTYDDAVRDFMRRASPAAVEVIAGELAELLEHPIPRHTVETLGANIWLEAVGMTDKQFLRVVLRLLQGGHQSLMLVHYVHPSSGGDANQCNRVRVDVTASLKRHYAAGSIISYGFLVVKGRRDLEERAIPLDPRMVSSLLFPLLYLAVHYRDVQHVVDGVLVEELLRSAGFLSVTAP